MSTLWTAASVTATNGSNLITVQSGEDIAAIRSNSWIMVGSSHIMEIKRTFVTDSGVKTIELFDDWEFGPISGQRATVAPSLGEFKTLADDVRRLIQIGEEQVNTASVSAEPDSFVKRSSGGTVRTAAPEDDNDAVRLQDFAPVKQKGESNEQAISSNSLAILRQKAMAKLERDAVFLGKFTEDRVVKANGLSKVATSVADGITYTSPDGITGVAADGTIQTAGVNQPPIVYDPETGECLGLQTAPGTTNLFEQSLVFDVYWAAASGGSIDPNDTIDSHIINKSTGQPYPAQRWTAVAGSQLRRYLTLPAADYTPTLYVYANTTGQFDVEGNELPVGRWYRLSQGLINSDGSGKNYSVISNFGSQLITDAYIIGAQLEQGYPTPYQLTGGSQMARGPAAASTPISLSSERFTAYIEFFYRETGNEIKTVWSVNSGNSNGEIRFYRNSLNDVMALSARDSTGVSYLTFHKNKMLSKNRVMFIKSRDSYRIFINGEQVASNSFSKDFSNFTNLVLGSGTLPGNYDQPIKTSIVSPSIISDEEAIALTAPEQ
ncbi:hypothetical protein [Idiomarina sp.]|uniref:hypothetical protein n=1 Tax=Idiomarina sp. TaxID=1874361 RepID=UPI0025C359FF|nr:hypothetical protein [Idiomarina sp.]